ncbi:MAG: EAL domain-containing protein [Clostridium butyricum]|nr:EAL domain-containing protein [Clostridium butyricum]MDU5820689.1 EAL domain-containing protein [Clostridium butyricum]
MGKAICFKLASKQYDEFIDVINTKNIRTVFQPIVSLEDLSVMGYEALSRGPENTEMQNPELLLKCAEECDKSFELEWLFICKALENSCHKKLNTKLFLNIDPAIISSIKFRNLFNDKCLQKYGVDFENIIFEITERNDIKNMNRFKDAINFYNSKNSKIAMDDVGSGYSGLNLLCNIKPQYLKLDNQLIRNIDKDKTKQALVTSMYDFSKVTNSILIAEGIETEDELRTLINIGIKYGQGYFIQRPSEEILEISDNIRQIIDDINIVKKKKIYK